MVNLRTIIYHPKLTVGLTVLGCLGSLATRNWLAAAGWVAATCGALWATSERDAGRDLAEQERRKSAR